MPSCLIIHTDILSMCHTHPKNLPAEFQFEIWKLNDKIREFAVKVFPPFSKLKLCVGLSLSQRCQEVTWIKTEAKVSSGASPQFVRTRSVAVSHADRNTSAEFGTDKLLSLLEWNVTLLLMNTAARPGAEPLYCLYVRRREVLSCSKTIFTVCTNFLFHIIQHKCWAALSLTSVESPLSVSPQCVDLIVRACLQSSHFSIHFSLLFNLCKAGISWTSRDTVSFLRPVNKNSSPVPEQQLADDSQEWSCLFEPSSVYGFQAQFSIKVFILFHEESHRVFFRIVAPVYQNTAISVHTSQYLAKVDAAEI